MFSQSFVTVLHKIFEQFGVIYYTHPIGISVLKNAAKILLLWQTALIYSKMLLFLVIKAQFSNVQCYLILQKSFYCTVFLPNTTGAHLLVCSLYNFLLFLI